MDSILNLEKGSWVEDNWWQTLHVKVPLNISLISYNVMQNLHTLKMFAVVI